MPGHRRLPGGGGCGRSRQGSASSAVDEPDEPASTEPARRLRDHPPVRDRGVLPGGAEAPLPHPRRHPDTRTPSAPEHRRSRTGARCPRARRSRSILDKPGLVHWGEESGVARREDARRARLIDIDAIKSWSVEMIRDVMKQKELRTWQPATRPATRGTSVHKALEGWAMTGDGHGPRGLPRERAGLRHRR